LALLMMVLLPIIFLLAWFEVLPTPLAELTGTAMLALLGNAVVCGAISNPHDRYGARIVWIAAFIVLLALARAVEQVRRARSRQLPHAEPLFY
jgi:glycerol uptake facilitator-like aquaporin